MNTSEHKMPGWARVLLLILPWGFTILTFQLLAILVAGIDLAGFVGAETSSQQLIIAIFTLGGTFLVLWLFMKFVDKEPFIELGFHTGTRTLDFFAGVSITLAMVLLGFFLLVYFEEISFSIAVFDPIELTISVFLFATVAIAEEMLFRGYILKNLMISFSKYLALIVSALVFSFVHAPNPNASILSLFSLFLSGIALGLYYLYTKNLWFPIGAHLGWNLFQTLLGFNVSGIDAYSLIEIATDENTCWNGGAFGFEGSYLSVAAELLLIFGIYFYRHKLKPKTEYRSQSSEQ
jgi:membrane protease YdiL (CAAX protease family)